MSAAAAMHRQARVYPAFMVRDARRARTLCFVRHEYALQKTGVQ
jgi:hypothetical protein